MILRSTCLIFTAVSRVSPQGFDATLTNKVGSSANCIKRPDIGELENLLQFTIIFMVVLLPGDNK